MRRCLVLVLALCLCPAVALAQVRTSNANCEALMRPGEPPKAFVVGTTTELHRVEISAPWAGSGRPSFLVCVPVEFQRHAARGMVNIRYQVYDSTVKPGPGVGLTEYESDTPAFQARVGGSRQYDPRWLPNVNIQDYQNYHGCRDAEARLRGRSRYLYREFHTDVDNQRSDTLDRRRRFLFPKDVGQTCNLGTTIAAGALEGLSFFGVSRAFGFTSVDAERIIGRRSVNIRYEFPAGGQVRYVGYVTPALGAGRCIRISANHVFWRSGAEAAADREPQVIGYLCTQPPR